MYTPPTRAERIGRACLVLAGVAIGLSIAYALMATVRVAPPESQEMVNIVADAPTRMVPAPAPVVVRTSLPVATNPLRWEDLTLMLRTGLRDEEIIAEAARKQLILSIDPAREQTLRSLGAGNRLLSYLRTQCVYAEPAVPDAPRVVVSGQAMPVAMAVPQTVYQPAPVVTPDYAARDRQVQSLKTQIDALDEQIRCIRTNPKDNRYWWHYYGRFNGIDQLMLDSYLNKLDQQRNDLRRQKWQAEGR